MVSNVYPAITSVSLVFKRPLTEFKALMATFVQESTSKDAISLSNPIVVWPRGTQHSFLADQSAFCQAARFENEIHLNM